jgi:regulator of cell morphogenesis and NO signaling
MIDGQNMIVPQQSLASIVSRHHECARVPWRHGIDYRRRPDRPLVAACRERGLDLDGILRQLEDAVAEPSGGDGHSPCEMSNAALVEQVSAGHDRVRRALPIVRGLAAKVARVHGTKEPRLRELVLAVLDLDDAV